MEKRAAPGRCWRASERAAASSTAQASSTRVPSTARLRPGARRSRSARRAGLPRRSISPSSATGRRPVPRVRRPARRKSGASASRGIASPSKSRGGAASGGRIRHSRCCSSLQRLPVAGGGHPDDLVGLGRARLGVDHRVVAGQRLARRRCVSARIRRALGSAIRSVNWATSAGPPPQRLDAGDVLAGQHQVDALRAAPPGQVLQQVDGLAGDRVPAGQQHLELVDHRDDPRPVPVRVLGAQLGELGRPRAAWRRRPGGAAPRRGSAAGPGRTPGRC